MTWFDGNAANLWKHTPVEEGKRYIACMGGVQAVMQKAQEYTKAQDLRFAATLLDHVVKAEPENKQGLELLAQVYEHLAFGAENAVWRNYYLTAAQNLKTSSQEQDVPRGAGPRHMPLNQSGAVEDWLDALSIRLDGPRACDPPRTIIILVEIPEQKTTWTLRLRNGTLTYRRQPTASMSIDQRNGFVDLKIGLSKSELHVLLSSGRLDADERQCKGDPDALRVLLDLCGVK